MYRTYQKRLGAPREREGPLAASSRRRRGSGPRPATERARAGCRAPSSVETECRSSGSNGRACPSPPSTVSPPASTRTEPSTTATRRAPSSGGRRATGPASSTISTARAVRPSGARPGACSHPASRSREVPTLHAENLKGGNEPPLDSIAREPRRRPLRARPDRDELLRRPGRAAARPRRSSSIPAPTPAAAARARADRARAAPAILSRTATGTTSAASPTWPRRPARPSTWPTTSAGARASRDDFTPPGVAIRAVRRRTSCSQGDETLELAGISFETLRVPGHSPGAPRLLRGRRAVLRRRPLCGLGRPHRPARRDWDTLVESIRSLADRFPPETVVYSGPRPADDARRRARPQPVPRGAARV